MSCNGQPRTDLSVADAAADTVVSAGGIPAHMVNGQGRWRLHASDPPEMVYKYRQSDLETKLKTSDL